MPREERRRQNYVEATARLKSMEPNRIQEAWEKPTARPGGILFRCLGIGLHQRENERGAAVCSCPTIALSSATLWACQTNSYDDGVALIVDSYRHKLPYSGTEIRIDHLPVFGEMWHRVNLYLDHIGVIDYHA